MAGLRPACDGFIPYGYERYPIAPYPFPKGPPPDDYNTELLGPKHPNRPKAVIPKRGLVVPPMHPDDRQYGWKTAAYPFGVARPASEYNTFLLKTNYDRKAPSYRPWSRKDAIRQTTAFGSSGSLRPTEGSSLLDLSKSMAELAVGEEKAFWQTRSAALARLDVIEKQGGLSDRQERERTRIEDEIRRRSLEAEGLVPPAHEKKHAGVMAEVELLPEGKHGRDEADIVKEAAEKYHIPVDGLVGFMHLSLADRKKLVEMKDQQPVIDKYGAPGDWLLAAIEHFNAEKAAPVPPQGAAPTEKPPPYEPPKKKTPIDKLPKFNGATGVWETSTQPQPIYTVDTDQLQETPLFQIEKNDTPGKLYVGLGMPPGIESSRVTYIPAVAMNAFEALIAGSLGGKPSSDVIDEWDKIVTNVGGSKFDPRVGNFSEWLRDQFNNIPNGPLAAAVLVQEAPNSHKTVLSVIFENPRQDWDRKWGTVNRVVSEAIKKGNILHYPKYDGKVAPVELV